MFNEKVKKIVRPKKTPKNCGFRFDISNRKFISCPM